MNYGISTLAVPGRNYFLYISPRPGFGALDPTAEVEPFLAKIKRMEISSIMVLMPEEEMRQDYGASLIEMYEKRGLETIYCPVDDFSVPEKIAGPGGFAECVEKLWNALGEGHVLVHCAAGLGRSGLAVSCLLVRAGLSAEDAVVLVRRSRPGTVQTAAQEDFVRHFAKSV